MFDLKTLKWFLSEIKYFFIGLTKKCKVCFDGEFYPHYGLAPHIHNIEKFNNNDYVMTTTITGELPENFVPDEGCKTHGVWYCENQKCKNHKDNYQNSKNYKDNYQNIFVKF